MKYHDHKLSKEEEFKLWVRREIAQLNLLLTIAMRVAKLDTAKLAEAAFDETGNDVFQKDFDLRLSEMRQKLEEKQKSFEKLSVPEGEETND